jgi:hypothetical protein
MNLPYSTGRVGRTLRMGVLVAAVIVGTLLDSFGADAPKLSTELQKTTVKADRLEMRNTGIEGHYVFI